MAPPDPVFIAETLTQSRAQAVAALLRYFHDLDMALAAFQEASLRAQQQWTRAGMPHNPLAWLIVSGRNAGADAQRRNASRAALAPAGELLSDQGEAAAAMLTQLDQAPYRDDVLRLLFICCHPTLPPQYQMALALRVVSGLPVERIARAFLIKPAAMEQRIMQAKRSAGEAGISFEPPDSRQREERMLAVMAMICLMFNEGYAASVGREHIRIELCEEAIRLARLLVRMFPRDGGALGLSALLMLQHARTAARLDARGALVMLAEQDRKRWDHGLIDEALELVEQALNCRQLGPYQIQAAIAAVHAQADTARHTDWAEIDRLYRVLETVLPSPVVTLNRSVAIDRLRGPTAALKMIEPLAEQLSGYAYYFGVRSLLLKRLGRITEASEALRKAHTLARSAPRTAHIAQTLDLF
ncbi:MAG: DUF6596 domain-containing protein [Pseudomonadota bacterium]